MTGPAYPHAPLPGTNAIGRFIVGVSPVGDIPPFDPEQTIASQYANSPIIDSLINVFNDAEDQTQDYDQLYDLIWNVGTAQGYGLDVWGRIVGVTRVLNIATGNFFGMKGPSGSSGDPFDVSPFYAGGGLTSNFSLTDSSFRNLIIAKALANISDGSVKNINAILRALFPGRGNCYVTDGGNMTMTYTFEFLLSPVELTIVQQSGVLPKPTGVTANVVQP